MAAPQFEAKIPKHCSSLLANNGEVSVSAKDQSRKGDLYVPEHTYRNDLMGKIPVSILGLKIFNIAIFNTYGSSVGSLG